MGPGQDTDIHTITTRCGPLLLVMGFSTHAVDTVTSVPGTPLQLGGGFIELAVLFFVLAIVAAVVGARGVAGVSMTIAKWFVIIFVVLAIVSLIL